MGKYNVGDKVRIVSERGANWNSKGLMDKHCGTVMTICVTNAYDCEGLYRMEEDRQWLFSDEDIVGLVNAANETKDDNAETPKYKVGDRVIIEESNIEEVHSYAGVEGTILAVVPSYDYQYLVSSAKNPLGVFCNVKCFAPEKKGEKKEEKIVITHDGKTTTATLYREDGSKETATARCAPEDTFDFTVGVKLAMERLMEKVNATEVKPEPPKYYNGKVVCVDSGNIPEDLIVGKIYNFIDGCCQNELGGQITNSPVKDYDDLQSQFISVKFIPLVE